MESLLDDVDSLVAPDLSAEAPDWCMNCQALRQEINRLKEEQRQNFGKLKQKIISTDLLIKKYRSKCDDYDQQSQRTEEANKRADKFQRQSEILETQLKAALLDTEPLRKTKCTLEAAIQLKNAEVQLLSDKLLASEGAQRQYEHLSKTMSGDLEKLETEKKELLAKLKLLESGKVTKETAREYKNEINTLKKEKSNHEKNEKRLEAKLSNALSKIDHLTLALKENKCSPASQRRRRTSSGLWSSPPKSHLKSPTKSSSLKSPGQSPRGSLLSPTRRGRARTMYEMSSSSQAVLDDQKAVGVLETSSDDLDTDADTVISNTGSCSLSAKCLSPLPLSPADLCIQQGRHLYSSSESDIEDVSDIADELEHQLLQDIGEDDAGKDLEMSADDELDATSDKIKENSTRESHLNELQNYSDNQNNVENGTKQDQKKVEMQRDGTSIETRTFTTVHVDSFEKIKGRNKSHPENYNKLDQKYLKVQSDVIGVQKCVATNLNPEVTVAALTLDNGSVQNSDTEIPNHGDASLHKQNVSADGVAMDDTMVQALEAKKTRKDTVVDTLKIISPIAKSRLAHVPNQHSIENKKLNEKFSSDNIDSPFSRKGTHLSNLGDAEHPETFKDCHQKERNNQGKSESSCLDSEFSSCNLTTKQIHRNNTDEFKPMLDDITENLSDSDIEESVKSTAEFASNGNLCNVNNMHTNNTESSGKKTMFVATPIDTVKSKNYQKSKNECEFGPKNEKQIFVCDDKQSKEVIVLQPTPTTSHLQRHPGQFDMKEEVTKLPKDVESFKFNALAKRTEFKKATTKSKYGLQSFVAFVKSSDGTLADEIEKSSDGTVADEIQNLCTAENDYEILDRDNMQKSVCKSSPNSEHKHWKNKLKKKQKQLREKCKYKSLDDKLDERVIINTINKTNSSRVMDDVINQSDNLDENVRGSNKINKDLSVRNLNIKLIGNFDHNPSLAAAVGAFNTNKMGSKIFEENAHENIKESSINPFQTERQKASSGETKDDTCLNQKTDKSFHNYFNSATITESSSLFKIDEVEKNVLETRFKNFEGSFPKNLSKEINDEGESMDVTLKTNLKNDAMITNYHGIPDNDDCFKISEDELNDMKQSPARQISLGFSVNTSNLERSSSTDSSKSWKMSPGRLNLGAFGTIAEENNTETIDEDTPMEMKNKTYNKGENVNLIFDVDDLISSGTVSEVEGKDCKTKQVHIDTNFPHLSCDKDTFFGNKNIKEISECDKRLLVSMAETKSELKPGNINEKQQSHVSVLPPKEKAMFAKNLNDNVKPSISKHSFKPINIHECESENSLQSAIESTTSRSLTPSLSSPDQTSPVSPLSLSPFPFIEPLSPIPPSPVQESDRDSPLSPVLETFEIESSAEPVKVITKYINTEVSHSMSGNKFVDTNKIDLKGKTKLKKSTEDSKDIGKEKIELKKYLGACQFQTNENSGNLLESNHCAKSELKDSSIVKNVLKETNGDRNVLENIKGINITLEVNGSVKIIPENAAIVEKSLHQDSKSIKSVLEDNGGNVPAGTVISKQSTPDKTPGTSSLDKISPLSAFISPLSSPKCKTAIHSSQQITASDFEMAASHSVTKETKTSSFRCINNELNHDLVSGPLSHINDVAMNMDNVSQKIAKKKNPLKILECKKSTEKPKKFSPIINKQQSSRNPVSKSKFEHDTSEGVKSKEVGRLSDQNITKREHNVRCSLFNEKSIASLDNTKINIASKNGIEKKYATIPVKKQELSNQNVQVINKLKDEMETDEKGDNSKVNKQVLEALPSGHDNWAFKRKARLAHKPNIPPLKHTKIQLIETPVLPPPKPSRKRQCQEPVDYDGPDKRPRKENVFQKQKNAEVETAVAKSIYTREDTRKMQAFLRSSVTAESMLIRLTEKSKRITEGYTLIDTCIECLSRVITDPLEIIYRECVAGNLVNIVTEFLFLNDVEKRAVYLFKYLINEANLDFTNQIILVKLWDSIFSRDVTSSIIGKMSLCRVFVALCALQGDLEQPRVLFYHIVTCGHLNGWQFVVPVVSVWPEILCKNQNDSPDKILTHGMILVLEEVLSKALSTQDTEIRKKINVILQKLCNWTCQTGNSDKILKILVTKLAECFEEQGISGCVFELVKAIELLSVHEGWSWFKEQFINRNGLQSVVNKYIAKNILKPVAPGYACAVLKITGNVMNALSEAIRSKDYQQIIKNWLMPFLTKQPGVATVRECCLETFIELSPLHPVLLGNLHKWFTSYKGHISDDVIARIEQIRILYQFKFGMHLKSFQKME